MKLQLLYVFALVIAVNSVFARGEGRGEGKDKKEDLIDLPPAVRSDLLKQAHVFRKEKLDPDTDVVELLKNECNLNYTRDASGKPIRPAIECTYLPRDPKNPFGGMMAKFDCQIQTAERGKVKTKVKYDPKHRTGGGHKEIPQAVLGTLLSRLIGIEGNLYCPVDLTCINCPSNDPWSQQKSQAGAVEGNRIEFKNVVIEKKLKGTKILQSNQKLPTHPNAFWFSKDLLVHLPDENKQQAIADREALAIWVNFIRHGDAGAYNMALICHGKSDAEDRPVCDRVSATINDYGDSFGYRNMGNKMELSRFKEAPGIRASFDDMNLFTEGVRGSSNPAGIKISTMGVKRFLQAVDQVSIQQLSDVLELAQIDTVSDSSKQKWIDVFRKKVESVRQLGAQ